MDRWVLALIVFAAVVLGANATLIVLALTVDDPVVDSYTMEKR